MARKAKPPEIPPEAARAFMRDLKAWRRTKNGDKQTLYAARQAEELSRATGTRVTLAEVREMFRKMRLDD